MPLYALCIFPSNLCLSRFLLTLARIWRMEGDAALGRERRKKGAQRRVIKRAYKRFPAFVCLPAHRCDASACLLYLDG
jgi:hypothetical protein